MLHTDSSNPMERLVLSPIKIGVEEDPGYASRVSFAVALACRPEPNESWSTDHEAETRVTTCRSPSPRRHPELTHSHLHSRNSHSPVAIHFFIFILV
jgi:hypothetical protein